MLDVALFGDDAIALCNQGIDITEGLGDRFLFRKRGDSEPYRSKLTKVKPRYRATDALILNPVLYFRTREQIV